MYRLTKKNFAVTRAMPRGADGNKRLKYMRVDRKGTTVADGQMIARVSLPLGEQPSTPVIYPKAVVEKIAADNRTELNCAGQVLMDGELPASTTADHSVPDLERLIPGPADQLAEFVCDGEELLILLKAALDVSEDADRVVKLRICNKAGLGKALRIDTLTFPGQQSFLGVVKAMQYDGPHIGGEADDTTNFKSMDKAVKTPMPLIVSNGRKFRG